MTNLQELSEKEKRFIAVTNFFINANSVNNDVDFSKEEVAELLFAFCLKNMLLIKYSSIQDYVWALSRVITTNKNTTNKNDYVEKYIEIFKPISHVKSTN